MADTMGDVISEAVDEVYAKWAQEHPSLAEVIDDIKIKHRVSASVRSTQEYKDAIAAYHQSQDLASLAEKIFEIAGPILLTILGA